MYKVLGADRKEYGPASTEQIHQWIRERRLNGQSLLQAEGTEGWKPLDQLPEFEATLRETTPPAPPSGVPAWSPQPLEARPRTHPMAITGLVMGVLALPLTCCCYGLPFNILGVIFSAVALAQIGKNPQLEGGRGLAIAGLILSGISLLLGLLFLMLWGFAGSQEELLKELEKLRPR